MERLAGILDEAGPDTLALIDEIGGATDPEEGSAIAIALLEAFVDRGGRALVTTHLTAIKSFAASRADALCAAMEFDDATGRPNYRLHAGLAGRSHALSVARERGFPEPVIARALEILGEAWQRRERAEVEAENAIERLRAQEAELGRERERAQRENERLEGERRKLAEERAKMLADGLEGFERARGELARRVEKELEGARAETARLAQVSAARLVEEAALAAEAEPVVALAREAEEAIARSVEVGQPARVRGLNAEGLVVAFDGDWAQMDVQGKRLRVRRGELEPVAPQAGDGRRKTEDEARGRTSPVERRRRARLFRPDRRGQRHRHPARRGHRHRRESARSGADVGRRAAAGHPRPRDRAPARRPARALPRARLGRDAPARRRPRRRQRRNDPRIAIRRTQNP